MWSKASFTPRNTTVRTYVFFFFSVRSAHLCLFRLRPIRKQAYYQSLRRVQLSGPTLFQGVIGQAASIANSTKHTNPVKYGWRAGGSENVTNDTQSKKIKTRLQLSCCRRHSLWRELKRVRGRFTVLGDTPVNCLLREGAPRRVLFRNRAKKKLPLASFR